MRAALFLVFLNSFAAACDVGTASSIVGWNAESKQLLYEVSLKEFRDGEKGLEEVAQPKQIFLYNVATNEQVQMRSRPPGFAEFTPKLLRKDDAGFHWKKQTLVLERPSGSDGSSYDLIRVGKKRKLIRAKVASASVSATEPDVLRGLFEVPGYVVGWHEACGSVQLWSVKTSALK